MSTSCSENRSQPAAGLSTPHKRRYLYLCMHSPQNAIYKRFLVQASRFTLFRDTSFFSVARIDSCSFALSYTTKCGIIGPAHRTRTHVYIPRKHMSRWHASGKPPAMWAHASHFLGSGVHTYTDSLGIGHRYRQLRRQ